MSIKLMSAIFETEMHDLFYTKDDKERKAKASTAKLLLLALADRANDYGESSYPGYDRLEINTCLSRQGISDTLEALEYNGLVSVRRRASRLNTNDYTINIRAFPPMYKEAEELPEVVKPLDQPESSHLTKGSQATGLDSSVNHQLNNSADAPLSPEELEQVNHKVDKILELSKPKGKSWEGRDLIAESDLPFADWYNEVTGQVMTKAVVKSWYKAFMNWRDDGVTLSDLQEAYDANKWRLVNDPNMLTKDARAIHALAGMPKTNDAPPVTYNENGIPESY